MSYRVKLNVFEGPFDLLVYLIEHARMSIYDIRVSEITKQYTDYLKQMQEADVTLASEFMVLAAELLQIKSKMLLPRTAPSEDGEDVYEDPRTELVTKLKEYKKYKYLAKMFEERRDEALTALEKPQEDLTEYTKEPDEYLIMDAEQFRKAFTEFLQRKKKLDEIRAHHLRSEKQKITTEKRMSDIRTFFKSLPEGERRKFNELVQNKEDKYDVSVTFSSILEMMKERSLDAEQRRLFGEIEVFATSEFFAKPDAAEDDGERSNGK